MEHTEGGWGQAVEDKTCFLVSMSLQSKRRQAHEKRCFQLKVHNSVHHMCVSVCLCDSERERGEGEGGKERQAGREREGGRGKEASQKTRSLN